MTQQLAEQVAVFGGGCFWCLDAVFTRLRGVRSVESGYAGGEVVAPDYHAVCSGATGHAEVVRIRFDPAVIDYPTLLDVFFAVHDPRTRNRQGHDVGTQYRSLIVCQDAAQVLEAQRAIAALRAAGVAAVTEVLLVDGAPFYPAEPGHQDYFARHPAQPYCQAVIAPKVAHLLRHFPQLQGGD